MLILTTVSSSVNARDIRFSPLFHSVADLFIVVLNYALTDPSNGHGREGFYFGANGEHSYYELTKAISKALVELGRGNSEEPTPFTEEEIDKYLGDVSGSRLL